MAAMVLVVLVVVRIGSGGWRYGGVLLQAVVCAWGQYRGPCGGSAAVQAAPGMQEVHCRGWVIKRAAVWRTARCSAAGHRVAAFGGLVSICCHGYLSHLYCLSHLQCSALLSESGFDSVGPAADCSQAGRAIALGRALQQAAPTLGAALVWGRRRMAPRPLPV
jgi:hypothetical protein